MTRHEHDRLFRLRAPIGLLSAGHGLAQIIACHPPRAKPQYSVNRAALIIRLGPLSNKAGVRRGRPYLSARPICPHPRCRAHRSILAVEHIEKVTQLALAPVDLVNEIAQRERAQYHRNDLAYSVKHIGSPASALPANDARHLVEEDFDRTENPLAAKFAANVRLQTGRLTVYAQRPGKRLQRVSGCLGVRNIPR